MSSMDALCFFHMSERSLYMIITQKKPMEELLAMLEGVKKAAIVGCANCATACQTGGEKEIQELKATLEAQGISPRCGR